METKRGSRQSELARSHGSPVTKPTGQSSTSEISAFLDQAKRIKPMPGGRGRVVLALDATMSRQPTWDMAVSIQAEMFRSAAATGKLSMQLVYFRGFGECRASRWAHDGDSLAAMMQRIDCRAGQTQIAKVLKHAIREREANPISAVVYIGDAMEENADTLGQLAGQLGLRNVPLFLFQEGHDAGAETCFRELARLTRGGWFRFDRSSPETLRNLLESIAIYATGGVSALRLRGRRSDHILLEHLGRKS